MTVQHLLEQWLNWQARNSCHNIKRLHLFDRRQLPAATAAAVTGSQSRQLLYGLGPARPTAAAVLPRQLEIIAESAIFSYRKQIHHRR